MAETLKSLDTAAGYGGTVRGPGVSVPAYDGQDWHKDADRCLDRLAEAVANAAALELFKDDGGALTFGLRPGLARNGDTLYTHAGCTAALTDDATNYIYLTAANLAAGNTVTVNTTGFPLQSVTPHIPLGTIVAASGAYTHDNISQTPRQRSMLLIGHAMTAANANTLVAGAASNADTLHIHSFAGLAVAVRAQMPDLDIDTTDDADGTGSVSIQIADPGTGDPLATRARVRVWIGTAEYGAPVAATDFSVVTGTQLREIAANADYEVISDATGLVEMNIVAAAGAYYVMAEVNGAIYEAVVDITGP
jgi:hypothetical protein